MTETNTDKLENEMSDLKAETPEETTKMAPKRKAAPKKKVAAKKAAKKSNGHDGNVVTIGDLAKDFKITTRAARVALRKAGLKAEGRWQWEKGSGALKKAEGALTAASAKGE